ncbi:MAG: hypothetical protein K6B74_07395 [Ruminococcus sp.]|nr:hypothetical protein [Ruminococcus sp.]
MGDNPSSEGFPPQKAGVGRKQLGERKPNGSKIKSAISRKSNKNAEANKSAYLFGNKEIADFICVKERSDFHATKARSCEISSRWGKAQSFAKIAALFCKYKIGNSFVLEQICRIIILRLFVGFFMNCRFYFWSVIFSFYR